MPKQISWSDIDVAIRKCHAFVLEAHRHVRAGLPTEGLSSGMNTRIAAIELRDRLNKIIETEKAK